MPGDAGDAAVGGAGGHRGHDGDVPVERVNGFVHRLGDFGQERRRRHGDLMHDRSVGGVGLHSGDGDLRIGDDALERLAKCGGIFAGKNAAIDVGARHLRERVGRVAAGEHRRDAGRAQSAL